MLPLTLVVPVKVGEPDLLLAEHLGGLVDEVDDIVVVDGSSDDVRLAHRRALPERVRVLPVEPSRVTPMGKVGGVLTGLAAARHDVVVIADDDVRWRAEQLAAALARLDDGVDVLRPQQRFDPLPWHARWDTGRSLIARALGGDWPGTLVVRRSSLPGGRYAGDVLFENLELVRTVVAGGGREAVALDLVVDRRPPTVRRFVEQRVREAYDELARPAYLAAELALLPAVAVGGRRAAAAIALGGVALAEAGRRRAGGRRAYRSTAALWSVPWLAERAVCSWVAMGARLRGGVRYRDGRLRTAAHSVAQLRRQLTPSG